MSNDVAKGKRRGINLQSYPITSLLSLSLYHLYCNKKIIEMELGCVRIINNK